MGIYVEGVIDSLKKSLNGYLVLYFLLVIILATIASGVVLVVFGLAGIFLASGVLGVDLLKLLFDALAQNPAAMASGLQLVTALSNPAIFSALIIAILGLLTVFIIVSVFVSSFFEAVSYFLARQFLNAKGDLGDAFSSAAKRFIPLFGARILVGILLFILAVIIFSPALIALPSVLQNLLPVFVASAAQGTAAASAILPLVGFLLMFLALLFIFFVILFLISPYLVVIGPIAVFENETPFGIIRRAIEITQGKYIHSIAFNLLFGIIMVIIALCYAALMAIFGFASFFAILAILLIVPRIIIELVFSSWISAWTNMAHVKLYEINSGSVPRHSSKRNSFVGLVVK
ncbi:MAG: hypothetical protein PHD95_06125 [Candidatus ainarchaeum sp.]|nr:hypothetical protein [Candidatus ainarchaeum sp.]